VHTDDRAAATTPGAGRAPGDLPTRADLPAALAAALDAAIDKGAKSPAILQVTEIAGYTDFVLLVSARNERQVSAIVDAVSIAARNAGAKVLGVEGTGEHLWDLLDFDDFMVHVFFHPVRTHYDLESMWSDAPRVALGLPADVMDTSELEQLALPDGLPTYHGDATFGGFDDEFGDAPPRTALRPRVAPRPRPRPSAPPDDSLVHGEFAVGAADDFGAEDDDFDDFDDDNDPEDPEFVDDDDDDLVADDLVADDLDAEPAPAKPRNPS
jgi:ribosome silencing factor RsfS/YbeB/iojap